MKIQKSLLVAASVATITLGGGLGLASAATSTSSGNTLVDKIATKFNLKKSDVQAVFDADHAEHETQEKQDRKDRLAQAVKDNKITQAQADYINKALDEIDALRAKETPGQQNTTTRNQVKTKMDALRDWATQNKVDTQYVMLGGHGGHGRGGRDRFKADDTSASSTSTSTTAQ